MQNEQFQIPSLRGSIWRMPLVLFLLGCFIAPVTFAADKQGDLSLEQIMADPDWMGRSPQGFNWGYQQKQIFYKQKAQGHRHQETIAVDLASGKSKPLSGDAVLESLIADAEKSPNQQLAVFSYQNDIYLADLEKGAVRPLTADQARQAAPRFIDNQRVAWIENNSIFEMDLKQGIARQIAAFKAGKDPEKKQSFSYLEESQPRLFRYLDNQKKEKEYQQQRRKQAQLNPVKIWYYGDKQIKTFRLSPNARWLLVGLIDKKLEGKNDSMPEFVTMDGYVNPRKVRSLVGTDKPENETFTLYDLKEQKPYPLDLSNLPGINDDPLKKIARKNASKLKKPYKPKNGARAVYAYDWNANQGVEWSDDSSKAAMMLFSYDNKDRWIITINTNDKQVKTSHWMSDEAWINDWTFNEFGWLPDNQTLYYLSEESGYSHLYIKRGNRKARRVTEGAFEVSDLTISRDGKSIYFKANKPHPGIYEIYRVEPASGKMVQLTNMGGVNDYALSPDEQQLLIRHSETNKMPELFLLSINKDKKSTPRQLTQTASEAFSQINWQRPEIVKVPSRHMDRPIFARLYKPAQDSQTRRPAVIFVHGAGYLQNAHQGWSGYFREYMFHNYLTQKGIVVLDMDYRASKGYGRDWRTAIYRNMGTPELEDLVDGAHWLAETQNVDPQKIGIYGGSYGGFMTFMALFKAPDVFAAGAALRPVTDWAHYNHGYTSNILNTPQIDPIAYERSSPIEFAAGLSKPLLIAHGMVDDNVFFKDSVRLVQRLIELKKTRYFETAIYPVEPHGFKQPDSWLDEYTRIDMLFDRYLLEKD